MTPHIDDELLTRMLDLHPCDGNHAAVFAAHPERCDICESGYSCGFRRLPCRDCGAAI